MKLLLPILMACAIASCASAPPPFSPDLIELKRHERLQAATLEIGDVFDVRVYGEKELSGTFRVGPDGSIRFPLINQVNVKGLTAEAIADLLRKRLEDGFFRTPQVVVFVKEFRSKKVFVLGEVVKPGTFPYETGMNIVQVITMAGGLGPLSAANRTVLTRVQDNEEQRIVVPVNDISKGHRPNILLVPGDIIFVPESIL
jgi:polysaccharide export outer membrane protein